MSVSVIVAIQVKWDGYVLIIGIADWQERLIIRSVSNKDSLGQFSLKTNDYTKRIAQTLLPIAENFGNKI